MDLYGLLKSSLDASELRGKIIANNIVNINTPGYKRKYVTFEETIDEVSNKSKIEVNEESNTSIRVDGNNVNLEGEKIDQAENTLKYNALISIMNTKLAITKNVIGGR